MSDTPVPNTTLTIDGNYLMNYLRDLTKSMSVLPGIEEHLENINGAVAQSVLTVHALDQRVTNIDSRVIAVERVVLNMDLLAEAQNASRRGRTAKLFGFGLQLVQGIALLYIAWQFFS